MHTHEKQFGLLIAELRGMDDVATVVGQKAGHALHNTALIDAGQIEYVFWMHDDGLMAKRPDVGRRRVLSHGLPSTLKPVCRDWCDVTSARSIDTQKTTAELMTIRRCLPYNNDFNL
jgi:hypothetical protein